ncbi:MAG TPA: DUF1684 domain-containing protein [Thermoanaerobaculia bacterium]|nr:DUF1684 domain-containing protein [Thermoanaerobaculia bacterium]
MKPFVAILAVAVLAAGCRMEEKSETTTTPATPAPATASAAPAFDENAWRAEISEWQKNRTVRLTSEDGWTTLVGLHWLKQGDNDVTLANGTKLKAVLNGTKVTLEGKPPMTVNDKPISGPTPLLDDNDEGGPNIVKMGTVRFNVIERGPRFGLRVKDSNAETRTGFKGLEYYPIEPKWRVEARLDPYNPVKKIPITDITGLTADSDSPGALVFTLGGQEYRLDPILEEGSDDLFLIFRDGTSKDTTYPAGRYLYAKKPGADGKTVIDFNRAYNPPCTFTPFATCPLPPLQNRLPIRIEAGEKKYAGAH